MKAIKILANNTIMKMYLKYFCAVLLVIGTSAHAWSQAPSLSITERVNIDASDFSGYYSPGANGATVGVVSVTTSSSYKNTCSSSPYIRLTSSSTMTVSVSDGVITQVHFSPMTTAGCGGNGMDGKFSANSGSINQVTWTNASGVSSVTFTATSTADFRNFTVTIQHTSVTCPFTFPSSISMTVASGDTEDETVNITGTTGYSVQTAGLSTYDLGGGSDDSELSSYYSIPTTITVLGEVPGTYYGTFDVDYQRLTPYSYYSISIPITVTVTGCMDIRAEEVDVHSVPTPTYNCSTGYWETTISWDAVTGANRYNVRLMKWNGSAFAYCEDWHNVGTSLSYTYTTLETGEEYRVKVVGVNTDCPTISSTNDNHTLMGSGEGVSEDFEITCPTVTGLGATITGILSNSANLSWSATPGLCTATYSVWVSANSDYSSPVWTQTTSANTTHALTGLSSNTLYYVKITAFNECGNSQTRTGTFTTAKELVDYRYMCVDLNLVKTDDGANPIAITSAAGQSVKAARTLTLNVNGATPGGTVTLSGTGLQFYETDGTLISSGLTTDPTTGSITNKEIVVAYAPAAYVDETLLTPDITVNVDGNNVAFPNLVKVRCLPDQFVIAAKAGSEWVALTAKISGMGTQDAVPIKVDNTTTPTKASIAMNTSEYSMLGMSSTLPNAANNRLKLNGTAAYLLSSQTSKVLDQSTSDATKTHINTGATATNAANSENKLFYEWKLVSTDLVHYTVTNSNTTHASNTILGYSTSYGKWGVYGSGPSVNQDIFLLPIQTVITDMEAEVMEWGTTSMALRIPGTAPSNVVVTLGGTPSGSKALTSLASGSDMYKVEGLSLTGNNCEVMMIADAADATKGTLVRKPILVSDDAVGSTYKTNLTNEVCASCDIVILNGGKLTADQGTSTTGGTAHTDFANIYVYPGGNLVLDGYSLGVKQQVYVRGGYSWLNQNTYTLPELYLNGDINFNGSGKIIYDYYIHNYQYYQFCLPYQVPLAKVTDEAGVDNFPVWVKHYNGALRAANADATSWDWYNGTNFEAGVGYIIAARPRQVEKVQNRPLSIIRFPLTNSAFNGSGEAQKSVSTTAHGIAGYNANPRTVTANNVGWNLIGNPYMATWKGDIGHSQLEKHPNVENWDGTYHWKDGATKYVTVMSAENGSSYDQYVASTTELKPFFPFFIQETASGGTGTVTFTLGNRMKKMPALLSSETMREAFVQIDMTDGESQDQTGVYVSNKYSDDLDFDDYEKMFGSLTTKPRVWIMHESTRMAFEAMSEERAAGSVPVGYRAPEEGEYTFTLSDYSNLENVESVLLNDSEEGVYNYDLLNADYTFSSTKSIYNDTRFSIRIVMKQETPSVITGTETIDLKSEKPQKFIWQNKMYILRGGVIYDATGKRVMEINK